MWERRIHNELPAAPLTSLSFTKLDDYSLGRLNMTCNNWRLQILLISMMYWSVWPCAHWTRPKSINAASCLLSVAKGQRESEAECWGASQTFRLETTQLKGPGLWRSGPGQWGSGPGLWRSGLGLCKSGLGAQVCGGLLSSSPGLLRSTSASVKSRSVKVWAGSADI